MIGADLQALQNLLKNNANTVFPTALSVKLARLKKQVDENINIYKEVLLRLINDCAVLQEDNKPLIDEKGNITLKEGKEIEWQKRYQELEQTDLTITITFTTAEMELLSITPVEAEVLLKLIKDPEN